MYLLGYDIGSSSIKVSLVDAENGYCISSVSYPESEAKIIVINPNWAEQNPEDWWNYLKIATSAILAKSRINSNDIKAIGISYQMHGLVCVDKYQKVLRPSIIWCDSRAVEIGETAFQALGRSYCLTHLLNSPGNFTASKLAWVKKNEPIVYKMIDKIMLPGDYIAMKLSGKISTTISGLSEGILWDFKEQKIADTLLNYWGISSSLIADIVPTFSIQGEVCTQAAMELGLKAGTPISYRSGDQVNNAFSLNVLCPHEIAATAGTSGVIYGINGDKYSVYESRVNTFAHVNYTREHPCLSTLMCINGVGILNSWIRKIMFNNRISYPEMNELASQVNVGSKGIRIYSFGNGVERMLYNKNVGGCSIQNIDFNIHESKHMIRATQEGIAFSFRYGIDILRNIGFPIKEIHAGFANMFLSPVFCQIMANLSNAAIKLYDTNGSVGAARGSGVGIGIYKSTEEALNGLNEISVIRPDKDQDLYEEIYQDWKNKMGKIYDGIWDVR